MSDRIFLDTNIRFTCTTSKPAKSGRLRRTSFANCGKPARGRSVRRFFSRHYRPLSVIVGQYCVSHVELNIPPSVIHASEVQERCRLSFWDALILAAASRAGSVILYSEDFSHDQIMEGVKVLNRSATPTLANRNLDS